MMSILALDLGTRTGWALCDGASMMSGVEDFSPKRFEGGGMRELRFRLWLKDVFGIMQKSGKPIQTVFFEEVRQHTGTTAAHIYGGLMGTLTSFCEEEKDRVKTPYQGVPVGTIKKHITGKGNANKEEVIDAVSSKIRQVEDDNEADALAILDYAKVLLYKN